jgi:purine-binding chemotaxis protein CheW
MLSAILATLTGKTGRQAARSESATAPKAANDNGTPVGQVRPIVTFRVSDQSYALDLRSVHDIRRWTPPAALRRSTLVRGVVELDGAHVPVLDLGVCLGQDAVRTTGKQCVIIIGLADGFAGLLVDAVTGVSTAAPGNIKPLPMFDEANAAGCIDGIITVNGEPVTLISGRKAALPVMLG